MKNLGNYKSTPDLYDGVEVGSTILSEGFDVGQHCVGMSYDGKSVGSIWLKGDDPTNDVSFTQIDNQYQLAMMHTSDLDGWEKLLKTALNHVRQLKKGEELRGKDIPIELK